MTPIPIAAAREIADRYGYDQVVIIGRKVGDEPESHGEHVTTYGRSADHSGVAAKMGAFFKHKLMGWPRPDPLAPAAERAIVGLKLLAEPAQEAGADRIPDLWPISLKVKMGDCREAERAVEALLLAEASGDAVDNAHSWK